VLPTDSHMGPSSYVFRGNSDLLMSIDLYEVRLRKDHRGVDLISDALPFGPLWGDRDERAQGRFQRVVSGACHRSAGFRFLNAE